MRTRRSPRNQQRLWRELGQQGATPAPEPYAWAPTLYAECLKRGIPIASHESDLYIPCTDETRVLLLQYGYSRRGKFAAPEIFTNQVEGGRWYDVAFAYAPFWREVARKAAAAAKSKGEED